MKINIYKNKLQVIKSLMNVFDSSFDFRILKGIVRGKLAGDHIGGIISLFPFIHNC